MDVGNPSNFVRILETFGHDYEEYREHFTAMSVSDTITIETMKQVQAEHGYLLDPHTAVGWHVADQLDLEGRLPVIVATAAPIKFAAEIKQAAGIEVDDSETVAALSGREKRKVTIENSYDALVTLLTSNS